MKSMVLFLLLCGFSATAQDIQSCPMHKDHQTEVQKHGDRAMGFPHDKTTHHFRLYSDGGAIEVTANNGNDSDDVKHIVMMFSNGDFSIPMFIHGQVPPGVTEMKDRQADISYTFEELPTGGKVRFRTTNHDALNAIHDFLAFQIQDHQTEDKTDVSNP